MPKCKVCGKQMPLSKMWCFGKSEHGHDWKDTTTYPKGLYCSPECAHSIDPFLPIHQVGWTAGCFLANLKSPFTISWWIAKKGCKLAWKLAKNKWVWTIFSCGLSWVAWRMLCAIYEPKTIEVAEK